MPEKPIIAVCGKGGVGKTSITAMLGRALIDSGISPILLIDADPVMGLTFAIGEHSTTTLASVRDQLILAARKGPKSEILHLANQIDYLILQSLIEHEHYSLLAMGHSSEKGCFCPANTLLRNSIDLIASSYKVILIDAEAGIEQISRDVTHSVNQIIAVVDGSRQSIETVRLIMDMVNSPSISVIANRINIEKVNGLPESVHILGSVPDNELLNEFNRRGRTLWELPSSNEAQAAVVNAVSKLGVN
jgi:CO dehydrogenase maturation factor